MPEDCKTSFPQSVRLLVFGVCASLIIVLVVACQPLQINPLATPFADVTGAIPDRGLNVADDPTHGVNSNPTTVPTTLSNEDMAAQNANCVACHNNNDPSGANFSDHGTMHFEPVNISCIGCHGGNVKAVTVKAGILPTDPQYQTLKEACHVKPRLPDLWREPGNPPIPGSLTLKESDDYIRFVNPGDLRAAPVACGPCHDIASEQHMVSHVRSSMMTHGAMLWEAALYNNGAVPRKNAMYAEFYDSHGTPASATANPQPTAQQTLSKGWLAKLWPLPRWEITQPGNILRVFERGGERRPIVGIPDPEEDPGRPDVKLSVRGLGTDVRTDPVFIGLQKSRLLDPTLNLFGTNDHPGDYRGSGCTGCHVVYSNDHSIVHSGGFGAYGNRGQSFSLDATVNPTTQPGVQPTTQPGRTTPYESRDSEPPFGKHGIYPIKHTFVKSAPTSSCIVCHVHPGTNVVNAYLGFTWWDNETDGQFMYPAKQAYPTPDDEYRVSQSNPEGAAARGLWSDPKFLDQVGTPDFNKQLKRTQFADFHGHGWVFRAVFKQDRHGNLLDHNGNIVEEKNVTADSMKAAIDFQSTPSTPHTEKIPVHLKDIHLEKGMHCVDCHFRQDVHGDGNLYGETRAAVEVECVDCHGSPQKPAVIFQYLKLQDAVSKKDAPTPDDQLQLDALLKNVFSGSAAAQTLDDNEKKYRQNMVAAHFALAGDRLQQIPSVDKDLLPAKFKDAGGTPVNWDVVQVTDTENPSSWWATGAEAGTPLKPEPVAAYQSDAAAPAPATSQPAVTHARLANFAHTIRRNGITWGGASTQPTNLFESENDPMALAHGNSKMSCYACHSSWNTSCFGCHLPMRANQRKPMLHNEGAVTRNYTNYNYQTLRDDVYMLGIDSTVTGHKVVPIRSACAVMVSSQNADREWIYHQQQTVSAEGYSGTAFSPYFPHTVRGVETKQCTDCHIAKAGDNNAIMAQVLMQGTHAVNFIGRYAWVGEGAGGVQAVAVTEHDEPQAVIGSTLHKIAYPDYYQQHQDRGKKLTEAYGHEGTVLDVQLRGEYLYAACGPDGFVAYDVAHIDDKNFSERIITAPVSALGQQFYVPSKFATSICSPSTMAIDPTRPHYAQNQENPSIAPLYAFLYMTDKYEGLIVIGDRVKGVATLLDGDPQNNFLQRALTFNPDHLLDGARSMSLYGTYAFICCDAGLKVLDLKDPLHPRVVETPGIKRLKHPKKIVFQFRFGFVIDDDGVKAINMTNPEKPTIESMFGSGMSAECRIADARDICLCRTYAYVAAGAQGLVVMNVERPSDASSWNPMSYTDFGSDGKLVDSTAVRVGMTNSSLFAYVADGVGGLKVLQLTSPEFTPTYLGFSPNPTPHLIATYVTHGPAIALSSGLDRDRAVDESGNQLSVFGRRGARPFNLQEQQQLYLLRDPLSGKQKLYTVTNLPTTPPIEEKQGIVRQTGQ